MLPWAVSATRVDRRSRMSREVLGLDPGPSRAGRADPRDVAGSSRQHAGLAVLVLEVSDFLQFRGLLGPVLELRLQEQHESHGAGLILEVSLADELADRVLGGE